jgi:hypothetical protein
MTVMERARGTDIRALLVTAAAVFVVTVVIGILNGLDLVEFEHNVLMTHVHAGTLGWITLAAFAACAWIFGPSRTERELRMWRWSAWLAIVAVPLYVLAFWIDDSGLRALLALPVTLAIVGVLWWIVARFVEGWTIPRLAMLAAVFTLTLGAFFGTLIQVQLALGTEWLGLEPAGGAHVTAMAFSYLVLMGMGLVRRRPPTQRLSRAGLAQVGALFAGGLLLTIGALTNTQALLMLNTLFQFVAVVIFVARLAPPVLAVPWLESGPARYFGASAAFVVVDIALLIFIIVQFVSGAYGPPDQDPSLMTIPPWLIFALDHAIFIGVMSNAIFGLMGTFTRGRDIASPWADHLVFWGMNVGMIGFVAGLAFESTVLKQAFSPVMGVSILIGLGVYVVRLWQTEPLAELPQAV